MLGNYMPGEQWKDFEEKLENFRIIWPTHQHVIFGQSYLSNTYILDDDSDNDTDSISSDGEVDNFESDYEHENVRYIRISNLSDTYDIEIGVAGAASNYSMLIPAGNSHIIARADNVLLAEADAVPQYGALADIAKIEVRPTASNDVNVEIFVATI